MTTREEVAEALEQLNKAQPMPQELLDWKETTTVYMVRQQEIVKHLVGEQDQYITMLLELWDAKTKLNDSLHNVEALRIMVGYLLEGAVQWRRDWPPKSGYYLAVWPDCAPQIAYFTHKEKSRSDDDYRWRRYLEDEEPGTYWIAPLWWAEPPSEMVKFDDFAREYAAKAEAAEAKAKADDDLDAQYVMAMGFMSALKPDMLVDVNDPMGMAQQVVEQVLLERRSEPQYPWEEIPNLYMWAATDANGSACAYLYQPFAYLDDEEWGIPKHLWDEHTEMTHLFDDEHKGIAFRWQDSLRYRPAGRTYGAQEAKAD